MHTFKPSKFAVVVLAALAAVCLAAPAAFGAYGDTTGSLGVPSEVNAGDSVTISADGFAPASDVTVTVFSTPQDLGTFTTDASGNVTATVTLPSDLADGSHTLTVSGTDPDGNPRSVSQTFTVVSASTSSSLPRTGASIAAISIAALALCGIGFFAVRAGRRRRQGTLL